MRALRSFTVRPRLPEPLQSLEDLAMNLRWSWDDRTRDVFRWVDPDAWEDGRHDPVALLGTVSRERLGELAEDQAFQSFLAEVPRPVLEAAELDGAGLLTIMRRVIVPVSAPGIAATALICFIFSWNEMLFARVLTGVVAGTAPVFLTSFVTSQGLFLAKVCAAATAISLPVLAAGFAAQDKLVQGLSLGAVK